MNEQVINDISEKGWPALLALSFAERAKRMHRLSELLRERADDYADLIQREMGKIKAEARAEVIKCASVCDYYADNAEGLLADQEIKTENKQSLRVFEPLGTILAVMPWNFPFWQVFRFAAPNVMAGNVVLLKHASNVNGCARAIEQLFIEAAFPAHTLRMVACRGEEVLPLIDHPAIKGVTLTGSTPAGRAIAERAGKNLKKVVLELGGNDPYLILADANLPQSAHLCAKARLLNAGQTCIAAKRFLVLETVYEQFLSLFISEMKKMVDDQLLAPLARPDLKTDLQRQIRELKERGAREVFCYGPAEGNFFPAMIWELPATAKFDQELFGPVAIVQKMTSVEEAINIANDSSFGLGAAIFSADEGKAQALARRLQVGSVYINDFVKSDPRLPFGGTKESGLGRELASEGIKEFLNIKTIVVK